MSSIFVVNVSQHDQSTVDWASMGLTFTDPKFTAWGLVTPETDIRKEVLKAWANIRREIVRSAWNGQPASALFVGGYAPFCHSVYRLAHASALPYPVVGAVMGPSMSADGQKKVFIPQGWRMLPFPEQVETGLPILNGRNLNNGELIHVSSRGLTPERRTELEGISTFKLLSPVSPANPPLFGVDMAPYEEAVRAYIVAAMENRCGFLFDGAAMETSLRLDVLARVCHVPCWFVRTGAPLKPGAIGPAVSIQMFPQF